MDTTVYYDKLAAHETLTEAEVIDLLRALDAAQDTAAHLASCQAATLESLPKSTSKCGRARHVSICKTAADALQGNLRGIRHPTTMSSARERCIRAVSDAEQLLGNAVTQR